MERLHLKFDKRSYDIVIDDGFEALGREVEKACGRQKILLVMDNSVAAFYGKAVAAVLRNAGFDVGTFSFEAGEQSKGHEILLQIYRACILYQLDRKSIIAALGGGVTGDMAGFAAASYMRGIEFVQIPTTLLAQTDSSVGGKVGIDFAGVKNIVGAFKQPSLVYINHATLKTLPKREFAAGMAEVIKYGIIYDATFFKYLEQNAARIAALEPEALAYVIRRCCEIKAEVVTQDETEQGLRAILNFGHTVGHGIESAKEFELLHGECVAIGMVAACKLALDMGLIGKEVLNSLTSILENYALPTSVSGIDAGQIESYMKNDKKKIGANLKFILPQEIGRVGIYTDVEERSIRAAVEYILR